MGGIVGVIGLGNMGAPLAANLAGAGFDVVAHDKAGPGCEPPGVGFVDDVAAVAARAESVVLSLPDGGACAEVAGQVVAASPSRVTSIVDTSTIGPAAAREIGDRLASAGLGYLDAPVSGGPAGARSRTLTVMYAGAPGTRRAVEPVLAGLSDRSFHVGDEPGMAQALKLANNFLSATALAATSEAIRFGTSAGLDMATMLDVLNASSGRNSATSDKFVNHVVTERYASGFANSLMAKDLELYLRAVHREGSPSTFGEVIASVWRRFADDEPGADFTRIYPFTTGPGPSDHMADT